MGKNWAVVIGVSQYESNYLKSQPSAEHDAQGICDLFKAAQFEQVYCFTQNSPDIVLPTSNIVLPAQPTYCNLSAFFEFRFREPFLSVGDNLWFFFSGHGIRESDRHYLIPQDGNFLALARTAFAVSDICNYLRCSGTDNPVLLLDADRSRSNQDASVVDPEHHPGVVSISACHPMQGAYSRENLEHGIFTQALLEVLRSHEKFKPVFPKPFEIRAQQCATLEQLGHYLRDRMPELFQFARRGPTHQPYIAAEPPERQHYIIFPERSSSRDLNLLKQAAYRCVERGNLTLAEQICQRVALAFKPKSSIRARVAGRQAAIDEPVIPRLDLDLARLQAAIQQLRSTHQAIPPVLDRGMSDRSIPFLSMILEDSLASNCNLDYQPLRDLLIAGQWQDADDETRTLMQQAVGREEEKLTPEQMQQDLQEMLNNPPDDLRLEEREMMQNLLKLIQQAEPGKPISPSLLVTKALLKSFPTPPEDEALELLIGMGELTQQAKDVEDFPFADLFTLDHLWVKYSQGRFGFSIQKRIYLACGGTEADSYDEAAWNRFGDRVGWRVNGAWLRDDRNFISNTIPDGYFPIPNFHEPINPVEFPWWWQLVQDA